MGQPPSGGCILSCEHRRPNLNVESFIMPLACTLLLLLLPSLPLIQLGSQRHVRTDSSAQGLVVPSRMVLFFGTTVGFEVRAASMIGTVMDGEPIGPFVQPLRPAKIFFVACLDRGRRLLRLAAPT